MSENSLTRKGPRIHLYHPVLYSYADNPALKNSGLLLDISMQGAQIKMCRASAQKNFTIHWAPVAGFPPHTIEAEILRDNNSCCGVQFTKITALAKKTIESLIYYHLNQTNSK